MLSGALESSSSVVDGDLKASDSNFTSRQSSEEPGVTSVDEPPPGSVKACADDVEVADGVEGLNLKDETLKDVGDTGRCTSTEKVVTVKEKHVDRSSSSRTEAVPSITSVPQPAVATACGNP